MRQLLLLGALIPAMAAAQQLDSRHLMVDSQADGETPFTYRTFQEAAAHLTDNTTVYIRPGVYWIDDPDDPDVRQPDSDGRGPFGMRVHLPGTAKLHLIGLGRKAEDVVLASQRGQTQGANGNFTMFDFRLGTLRVENLTMGNYCNADLVYPLQPALNRKKRSDAITQAHVGYVRGDSLVAKNVRFISRLNLNPLNGARQSYYEDCHFECTDDALNGTATYRHCNFDFYGQKPFYTTHGAGALFVDCDFNVKSDNREVFFCKQGGPVTVVNCRYHAPTDSIYIGWTAYPQPWLRCYQQNFTLNGKPYTIGYRQPQNTVTGATLSPDMTAPPYLTVSQHEATILTARDTLRITAMAPAVTWHVAPADSAYVTLLPAAASPSFSASPASSSSASPSSFPSFPSSPVSSSSSPFSSASSSRSLVGSGCAAALTVLPTNTTGDRASFCLVATTPEGYEAACHLTVLPAELPAPSFLRTPRIKVKNGIARLDAALDLQGCRDESDITWLRDGIPVSVSHDAPQHSYRLDRADIGHTLSATIKAKSHRSAYGPLFHIPMKSAVSAKMVMLAGADTLATDFHDFPCQWQPQVSEGYWTVDGYKPADTAGYPWDFDRTRPMWEYNEGYNGAVGKGLLQAQRGARLMYTPLKRNYGDMHLVLNVDPTKTAGQGFGSATGQYMDVCLKFDTQTLTGYGLRIIRTTKHAKAVDFLLVRYDQGRVTPLTAPVSATCYRTGCTISLDFIGDRLRAHVETASPPPADSALPHQVDLEATAGANTFGGICIQHTGSCGESTTMLHGVQAVW